MLNETFSVIFKHRATMKTSIIVVNVVVVFCTCVELFYFEDIYICQYSGCGSRVPYYLSIPIQKILTFLCMIPNPIRIFQKEFCFRVERAAAQSAVLPSDLNHNLSLGWKD